MKLYYSPGVCSLASHIALQEAGLSFETVLASTRSHKLLDGTDYYTINPKGYVPLLEFDNGERLTEGPAIMQWIADQAPTSGLAPANGTMARYRLQEWLNFISTEVHKGYSPMFNPAVPDEVKAVFKDKLMGRYGWLNEQLNGKQYLMGDQFTVADGYLFTVSRWSQLHNMDLGQYPHVAAYLARVEARPAVQAVMKAEGLLK